MASNKSSHIKWTDDELVIKQKTVEDDIRLMKEDIESFEKKIISRKEYLKTYEGTLSLVTTEMEKRGIMDFEERMRRKHGSTLSDKQWRKVYRLAWDEGHSAGENEVENHLIDYVELFED